MSEKVTPGDGSCMFHAILDQIQSIQELQDDASSLSQYINPTISSIISQIEDLSSLWNVVENKNLNFQGSPLF